MSTFLSPMVARPADAFQLEVESSRRVLASAVEAAFDSRTRKQGLLNRTGLDPGMALVLAPCGAIHTFFMRFPIDVVFVRRDGTVARVVSNLAPWRIAIAFGAHAAIELAAGGAARCGTSVGDRVRLTPVTVA
jgi:uncharacterized membrane protein (UPF0127 family)